MSDPIEERFDSEAGYRAALDATLALAGDEVCIFDRDLARMALEAPARSALIERFLAADRNRRLRVVLHDTEPLERSSPRLLALIRRFGHAVEVRHSADHLRHLADCLLLADAMHATVRFHADHARGKRLAFDSTEVRPYWQRFADLWEASLTVSPAATTGL